MGDSDNVLFAKSMEFSRDTGRPSPRSGMTWSLYDAHGQRKYLTSKERAAFIRMAVRTGGPVGTFCSVMALTGARISEVLALTPERIDRANGAIVFETLKRRERGIFRAVPIPYELVELLYAVHNLKTAADDPERRGARLWRWSRPTAWKHVKSVMRLANIPDAQAMPKALRHAFGVEAVQDRIAITLVKKWLGHAKLQSTEIYATPLGREERRLAAHMWRGIRESFSPPLGETNPERP
ncbi:MAG: tyrosine-type recombinase/integrase [Rhizomicrobium sp.]|nr:tyrosine-type recombinase/integrase [Rhizomicrobium sp.]